VPWERIPFWQYCGSQAEEAQKRDCGFHSKQKYKFLQVDKTAGWCAELTGLQTTGPGEL
jgi:hypothetical protein